MAFEPDLVTAAIRSLNRKNLVPSARAVDPNDVRLVSVVVRDERTLDVTVEGKSNKPTYGQITAQVFRQNIADYFAKITLTAIPTVTSVHKLLPELATLVGLSFLPEDFEDLPIVWVDNKAQVTFQSKPDSYFWYGSITLNVENGDVDINTVYTYSNYNPTAKTLNKQQWIDNYSALCKRTLDLNKVEVSLPQKPSDLGISSTYNTIVTLTAKPNSGLYGVKYVHFSRIDIGAAFEGKTTAVPDDFTGDLHDALATDNIGFRTSLDVNEVERYSLDTSSWPIDAQLKAIPDSYRAFGVANIKIGRYADDTKSITIDFNNNNIAMTATTIADICRARVAKAAQVNLTINVAAGVYLVGAKVTDYALTIPYMSQYANVNVVLNNRGFITGRGAQGSDTGWPNAAGNGLFIDPNFKGSVAINNLGTIAGGGGGGGMSSALNYVGGGGGQPLGAASNTKDSGNFYAGPAATLTAPGASREVWRSDTLYYFGGAGGGLGQPGKIPGQRNGNPPYYAVNQTTAPGDPGKSVVDTANIATWITAGITMPPVIDQQELLNQWLDIQDARVVSDTTELDLLEADGKFIVQLDSKTNYYTDRDGWTLASKLQCYGQVWGQPVGRVFYSRIPGMLQLGMENENVFYYNYRKNNRVYFEFESTPTRVATTGIYRNFTQGQALNTTQEQVRLKRIVYYDPWRGYVVDVNPYLKTIERFTGFVSDLSKARGTLDGFKK